MERTAGSEFIATLLKSLPKTRSDFASDYFNTLAAITTGAAPTLLAGRVAAGHARPDDSWRGPSVISSLRFEAHPQADADTCSQEGSMVDLEASQSSTYSIIASFALCRSQCRNGRREFRQLEAGSHMSKRGRESRKDKSAAVMNHDLYPPS
ncbi:hypothetical protein EDD18DRAFT_1104859 [Armillaria luteobubalina]|uniref:Uncharacterized protein n=1 Tax=Armillaria luteobubalina TaxID=153913 RepID=A0AA39TQ99_9AGAR|nr:hypothetical protein EDD18DRAFT_1104859 [Armillaria luteobubalina]